MLLNCPRLTHLSLTGVNDFLRPEYIQFCREAPPGKHCVCPTVCIDISNLRKEFNDHQRDMFCVYSGDGVAQLREYLKLSEDSGPEIDQNGAVLVPPDNAPHQQHYIGGITALMNQHIANQHAGVHLPPPPPHAVMPQNLTGHALAHIVGMANRPPPPPPAHFHQPNQQQLPPGIVPVPDDDEDLDDDMRDEML